MASGPITWWQIDGETEETVSGFIFLGSKITADGDCSHEIKRHLLLGRKVMTNLDSIFKSKDITLAIKAHLVKAMVFPVVMYGCENWTIKNAAPFSSVTQSCLTLLTPWTASHQASLSIINSQSLLKPMSIESVMPYTHLILCHPLLLPPSIFPSIRVFSMSQFFPSDGQSIGVSASTSVLPKNTQDWFFFRIDWLDLFAVQGTFKESSPTSQFKIINSSVLSFLYSQSLTSIHDYWKNHSLD